ncbi:MAG: thioredoxin domain-containing protein [Betaproteobacteria bacterium]|nr:thioredoxin domain-containing protein [Betaproteobacteria bacterium]
MNQCTTAATIMSIATLSRVMMAGLVLFATAANAQTADRRAADAALVDRVKDTVIKELRESGAIDRAVDAGIGRYVERQRAAAAQRERAEAETRVATLRPVSQSRDHIRGNPAAPVTLVEYSDFECPFCKRFHATMKRLVEESNGKLKWAYRHFPLEDLHPVKARKEAVASECAAELGGHDAFWKFADRFFELTPSNNRTDIDAVLPKIAREIGLDKARFASCLASTRHDRRVAEDAQDAAASGGRGTPWSLIVSKSGKTYPLSGAQPYAVVKQLVELAREEK